MKWVTRNFPGVDRTASAWLIKKFIDPEAEFVFINWPEEKPELGRGIPFDIEGVELGHKGSKCTFEVMVEKYSIKDPYVLKIAEVVHAADIEGEIDKAPEARGVKAIFSGLRFVTKDDHETLDIGMKVWEALNAYFKLKDIEEKHRDKLKSMPRTERLRFLEEILREQCV